MPFTGDTFAHLFDWEKDPQRQEKIVNSRLEAELDGLDTGLSAVAARATVTESIAGTTAGQVQGTNTGDNAAAGKVGQYVSSTVASGSAVSLSTVTTANVTSISLSAGDWDVSAQGYFAVSVAATDLRVGISTTSATFGSFGAGVGDVTIITGSAMSTAAIPNGPIRLSLNSTTTVFMVALAGFASGTASAHGTIRARRVR